MSEESAGSIVKYTSKIGVHRIHLTCSRLKFTAWVSAQESLHLLFLVPISFHYPACSRQTDALHVHTLGASGLIPKAFIPPMQRSGKTKKKKTKNTHSLFLCSCYMMSMMFLFSQYSIFIVPFIPKHQTIIIVVIIKKNSYGIWHECTAEISNMPTVAVIIKERERRDWREPSHCTGLNANDWMHRRTVRI